MADKNNSSTANQNNFNEDQLFDIDIKKIYDSYVKSPKSPTIKEDTRGIDDYRSQVNVRAVKSDIIAKAMEKYEHHKLFKATNEYQESRCHAFYRMIGFPVYDSTTNNFYNPGFDNQFKNPDKSTRNITRLKKIEIAINSIKNKELTKLFDVREDTPRNFLKLFSTNESLNSSVLTLSGLNLREFVSPLKNLNNPLFSDTSDLDPLKTLYVIETEGHVGKYRPDLYEYIGINGVKPTLDKSFFKRNHVIYPFLTDARYTESLNVRELLAAPFLSPLDSVITDSNNKASETITVSSPMLESIIINRLSENTNVPSEEIKRIQDYIKDVPEITDSSVIKQVFNSTKYSEQQQLEHYLYMIKSMLYKLVIAQQNVESAMEEYYFLPIPSTNGPEYGVSFKPLLISKELAQDKRLITKKDMEMIKSSLEKSLNENIVASKEYTKVAEKKKVFPHAAIIFNPEVNESCGDNNQSNIKSLTDKRNKILKSACESLQIIEMIMGEFSGLGLCDILAIIASLYIIPQEYLLGFLDDDAFIRMKTYMNIEIAVDGRKSLIESQAKLADTVKDFYNLMDKIYLSFRIQRNSNSNSTD